MNYLDLAKTYAGQPIARSSVPEFAYDDLRAIIIEAVQNHLRLACWFGDASSASGDAPLMLYAVLADARRSMLRVGAARVSADRIASLTPECPQAHHFECEIAEQFGIDLKGHPCLKRPRRQPPLRAPNIAAAAPQWAATGACGRIEGEEIHEVAVGPVHAGIIEPGHFRFQCHGEKVFHLEIDLGYQHRGVERAVAGSPHKRSIHLVETAAGDTSVGHATAYCQTVEALAGCRVPIRAEVFRGIALELERLANHTGDLGALAGDIAFLPTAAFCGRLRGDFLNLTALVCGSRFGRGLIRPGGVGFDLDQTGCDQLLAGIDRAYRDVARAVDLLWNSSSVQARFEGVGCVSPANARRLGLVGPPARAAGLECDVRQDFPAGIFRFAQVPVSTATTGDVFARAYVRWLEIQRSVAFIRQQLEAMPQDAVRSPVNSLQADKLAVALVEGWRGEICHVAITDEHSRIARYKIVDPSFHNWAGLAVSMRDQPISDFPLCNKSFNLSYCGHDL
jgi:Ni,Fe-hydrogenase III large subunit